ncbi:DinB family protein [Aegicerativicinus sediminis]|uniref:DinB family protein n=1 Tax=Aegicerativicinus sediminis TaxID=2893202 RepID=UPI001E5D35C9|nr:DinB family protein [Aegicerativicinus sediminis]
MDFIFDVCYKNRALLERFLNDLSITQLNQIPEGFNNNIIWNVAHVIATQQILVYEKSQLSTTIPNEIILNFKKGTKPKEFIDSNKIEEIKSMLFMPIDQTINDLKNGKFKLYDSYTVSTGSTLTNVKDALQFNNFHEGIHLGSILAIRKLV